jgi:hypothetical protein
MNFRMFQALFASFAVIAIAPTVKGQAGPVQPGPGSSAVNFAVPGNGDIDIRE